MLRQERQARLQLENQNLQLTLANEDAEQARLEAEHADQAKSIFLANMSHEIRTPMNAVLGYAQILESDPELGERQRNAIKTIERSGEHLLGLINAVLDISKIEAGREELHPVDFDLLGLLNSLGDIFSMRCEQKGLEWGLEVDVPAGRVHGDEGKLRQVLINLLGNAVKFAREGEVRLAVVRDGEHYEFCVSDTGPGIPKEKQAAIFEPFQQDEEGVRQGGTGLGLAISSRHVEMMGGAIGVESTPGAGARFFFTLSLPAGQEPDGGEEESDWTGVERLAAGQSVRALVVDDVQTNRDVLAQILMRLGVDVELAANGAEGLERVRARMPDIILLDIRMPVMDGPEMLRRLLEEYGREATKVVAVTASVFEHQQQRYLESGFADFIDKPLRVGQIYACLAEQLGVEYERSDTPETPEAEAVDWQGMVLPAPLHQELLGAVERHSITELRDGLEKLENLSAKGRSLAAHLQGFAQRYDMNGVKAVLQEIEFQG
jgi:CheY-like chemotaxis protein/nitrogen-specific signal transduction histidine kinase